MNDLIVIPSRFGSSRLPGKPLVRIRGRSLLERVAAIAMGVRTRLSDVDVVVATDDPRIQAHATELGISSVMTGADISSGSDRALAAAEQMPAEPRWVLNLQGDAPFTTVDQVSAVLAGARSGDHEVTTAVVRLGWEDLDALRHRKRPTPFSGTTCVRAPDGRAYWFSKTILPAIRNEEAMRRAEAASPVFQHIGLYCYRIDALRRFQAAPESPYERLEGLEQLRLLELDIRVQAVEVAPGPIVMSGVDNPEDIDRAEALITAHGDPFVEWRVGL